MKLGFPIILLCIFVMMLVGQTMYQSHLESNEVRPLKNISFMLEEALQWNETITEQTKIEFKNYTDYDINLVRSNRVTKVLNSFINFIGTTIIESAKFFVEFGYDNPQYDYNFMILLIKYYFAFLIIGLIIPIIIPVIALLTLLVIGIKNFINWITKKIKLKKHLKDKQKQRSAKREQE